MRDKSIAGKTTHIFVCIHLKRNVGPQFNFIFKTQHCLEVWTHNPWQSWMGFSWANRIFTLGICSGKVRLIKYEVVTLKPGFICRWIPFNFISYHSSIIHPCPPKKNPNDSLKIDLSLLSHRTCFLLWRIIAQLTDWNRYILYFWRNWLKQYCSTPLHFPSHLLLCIGFLILVFKCIRHHLSWVQLAHSSAFFVKSCLNRRSQQGGQKCIESSI